MGRRAADKNFQKSRFTRASETRNEFQKIYIFCEGEETEVNYFNTKVKNIRRKSIVIEIKGTAKNTLSLVNSVLHQLTAKDLENINKDIDVCRVVLDEDDHGNFDNAISKAEANNIKVAYSVDCFELWYILHLKLCEPMHRDEYEKIINSEMNSKGYKGFKYNKNRKDMYDLLKVYEGKAISNAKYLEKKHDKAGISILAKRNPSTTVYKLVEYLNSLE